MRVTWLWGTCFNPGGPIALVSIRRQWPFMSHHFFAVPHCYPLHKEAALFVHCCKCQTYLRKFICISGCTQHALALSPYGLDVYWGPPADLGNKVFPKSKYLTGGSLQVVLNTKYVMNSMGWDFGFCTGDTNPTCPDNVKHYNVPLWKAECLQLKERKCDHCGQTSKSCRSLLICPVIIYNKWILQRVE